MVVVAAAVAVAGTVAVAVAAETSATIGTAGKATGGGGLPDGADFCPSRDVVGPLGTGDWV